MKWGAFCLGLGVGCLLLHWGDLAIAAGLSAVAVAWRPVAGRLGFDVLSQTGNATKKAPEFPAAG
jgi:hypothetical protein